MNPAAYPPLEHSARMLADAGFEVMLLGTDVPTGLLHLPPHDRIQAMVLPAPPPGWRQKLHYLRYAAWVLRWCVKWRPSWLYASDPLACPVAALSQPLIGARLIYHEHDSPPEKPSAQRSGFMRLVMRARGWVARRAELCVLPNSRRADVFRASTGSRNVVTVWNCPTRDEVVPERASVRASPLRAIYHGSIVPERLPRAVFHALARLERQVSLVIVGYSTLGHETYLTEVARLADELGIRDLVQVSGTLARRADLIRQAATCDVGLSLLPNHSPDINLQAMFGASNKVFDYMACGLAVLVSNQPEWRHACVDGGFGLACDPESADEIARALTWFLQHPADTREMGRRGQQQIREHWNYERSFAPVLERVVSHVSTA